MDKRKIIFGGYDTALNGGWTLTDWALAQPALKESYVTVPGHDGDLDLSTVLTDGEPRYGNRALTATFESSEGTRLEREAIISEMMNELDGLRLNIVLPDDPQHYVTGRVRVARLYNDPAHASVQVTATCEPWRHNAAETVVGLPATSEWQTVLLYNMGRRSVVPTITVPEGGTLTLAFGGGSPPLSADTDTWPTLSLSAGTHTWPALYLTKGTHALRYMGTGTSALTYREAVL